MAFHPKKTPPPPRPNLPASCVFCAAILFACGGISCWLALNLTSYQIICPAAIGLALFLTGFRILRGVNVPIEKLKFVSWFALYFLSAILITRLISYADIFSLRGELATTLNFFKSLDTNIAIISIITVLVFRKSLRSTSFLNYIDPSGSVIKGLS